MLDLSIAKISMITKVVATVAIFAVIIAIESASILFTIAIVIADS